MVTLISNGSITCPHCEHIVDVKQQRIGATYTQSWEKIPPKCMQIVNWWMNSHSTKSLTKQQLLYSYSKYHPTASTGGFFARISELLGLGIITASKEVLDGEHRTRVIPVYTLNKTRARSVIFHGGKLN
jgi:hypothetical protein